MQGGGDELRASDAEREATAQELRRAHGDGRIATEELEERLSRVFAARTRGELATTVADLPPQQPPAAATAQAPVRAARARAVRRLRSQALVSGGICLLAVGVWLASGANGGFWPVWVFLLAGVRLVFIASRVLSAGDEPPALSRAQRRIERRSRRG
jgi:hypothetical protein